MSKDNKDAHRWSGWPGAFCMNCGAEHALENAIGLEWYDPANNTWDTQEHKELVEKCDSECKGEKQHEV